MRICKRAIHSLQIVDDNGTVRICGWQFDDGIVGNIIEQDIEDIYNSPQAKLIRKRHAEQDFSNCNPDSCPYVANNTVSDIEVELEEMPKYPESIMLAYENICNYRCVMCTVPGCLDNVDMNEREKRLNIIDKKLEKYLPHVKWIGTNGMGELFASKHILNLLSNWKPLADPSEIRVSLESNGSLFNEENWKKIENLGQYNLTVTITVLSFDPDLYQELSGTKLPIENIISNLKFIKSLRDKGIINYLELGTVVQEKNFREIPLFAKRCVEEFGADYVRLRPYEPWTSNDTMDEWFKDVRNEYHPYNKEYIKVMSDPYLKHPKVHDWSGGHKSSLGRAPYKKIRTRYDMIEKIISSDIFENNLSKKINKSSIVVYGGSVVAKVLIRTICENYRVEYIIDRNKSINEYMNIPCYATENLADVNKDVTVIIALERSEDAIKELLKSLGYDSIVSVRELTECSID